MKITKNVCILLCILLAAVIIGGCQNYPVIEDESTVNSTGVQGAGQEDATRSQTYIGYMIESGPSPYFMLGCAYTVSFWYNPNLSYRYIHDSSMVSYFSQSHTVITFVPKKLGTWVVRIECYDPNTPWITIAYDTKYFTFKAKTVTPC